MKGELAAFVDSNVLVYAVSRTEPEKQKKARVIVERGFAEGCFAISTQVLLEVYVNITQKAAREAGCTRVLSEDLAAGRDYGGITVINPFS